MTTKKELVWRLGSRPTVEEVTTLIEKGIITQEEAREILFREEDQEDRDTASLKEEIKFLRKLVEDLSKKEPTRVVEYIYKHTHDYPWFKMYQAYCSNLKGATHTLTSTGTLTGQMLGGSNTSQNVLGQSINTAFSSIKTF